MNRNPRIEAVFARLGSVTQQGPNQWRACCPAHHDRTPSLSVSLGDDGRVLLHCFAGCAVPSILEKLGLSYRDLAPDLFAGLEGDGTPAECAPRIAAAYDYTGAQGTLLYQVVRYEPKAFRQRRPDGQGGWTHSLQGTEPVLYRLPAVFRAVGEERTVYVVEGEKDVLALEALGMAATTAPMGAGKWRPSYSEALAGAHVVILPDNDEPGRGHARLVAGQLYEKAASVRVVELPGLAPKGDVSDWIAGDGTKEASRGSVNSAAHDKWVMFWHGQKPIFTEPS